jgi:sodium-dependent dicarboxylate transporter 2/3/5
MSQIASRRRAYQLLGHISVPAWKSLSLVAFSLALALGGAYLPEYPDLVNPARNTFFILLFCALLWITEAMPAFAVSLLAIGLEIAILGRTDGAYAEGSQDWQRFIATWGSPLIWLFFGGFVLAQAAEQTCLDRRIATSVLGRMGRRPAILLGGVMGITAVLSMFISNTATATLMLGVLTPLFAQGNSSGRFAKALLMGVAFAANIGGMGTVIGSPPNAIAVGELLGVSPVNFAVWMAYAIPPVIVLLSVAWLFLVVRYFGQSAFTPIEEKLFAEKQVINVAPIRQINVVVIFALTIGMWVTNPWHGIPTTVVSFIPICAFTATGVLGPDDIRKLPWDVLLLIAGGLSLGVAIADTGLADWVVGQLPLEGLSPLVVVLAFCYLIVLLSNLMSNTAAANMILPMAMAVVANSNPKMVVPIALSASAAMCLPISTPPNAIIFSTRRLATTDLLAGGLLLGLIAPPVVTCWAACIDYFGWY